MQLNDWLVVLATLLSPLIAIQVSELMKSRSQVRDEQFRVFKTLMSTRASILDPRHVECLNLIDVVFHTSTAKEKEIRRLWKQYLHHLGDRNYPKDSSDAKRVELLVELLHSMAIHLGYDFDKTHITTQCYYPDGYGDLQNEQGSIRRSLAEILNGKQPLPIWVANLPPPSEGRDYPPA